MSKYFLKVIVVTVLIIAVPVSAVAKETVWWKDSTNQEIPSNKWTYLTFDGKTTIKKSVKGRALYCSQVHLKLSKNHKPRYVKLRFARKLENGKLDTTGTTTWTLGKNAPLTWQGSVCWPVNTTKEVAAQIKIGGSGTWTSPLRQFKVWAPKGGFDDLAFIDGQQPS
jgi:hypothetical protein